MTPLNWHFIERLEGGIRARGYVPTQNGIPLGQSGVTVGAGVDLGHWTEAQLIRRRVPRSIIERVRPFLGLRGYAALEVASDLRLTPTEARELSRIIQGDIVDAIKDRYDRAIKPGAVRWDYLPSACKTVVTSVGFQYGPAMSRRTPTFWKHVTAQDWGAATGELRNFGDLYPTRRNAEADHLATILKET